MEVETLQWCVKSGWSAPFRVASGDQTLVVVFAGEAYDLEQTALAELTQYHRTSVVLGCSTAGAIGNRTVIDTGLSVAIARFEHTQLRAAYVPVGDSHAGGLALAHALSGPELAAVFVLSEGVEIDSALLVKGLRSGLHKDVPVSGALAGDSRAMASTWVLVDGDPCPSWIAGVGLYGTRLQVNYAFEGGWDGFGPERLITRSEGNTVYELDGEPALALYKRYLGERALTLPSATLKYPMAIRKGANGRQLVRTTVALDEATQSLSVAGDMPMGWYAQLMMTTFDRLVDGAEDAAHRVRAQQTGPASPTLAIIVSCAGRRWVLEDLVEEEVDATVDALPTHAKHAGLYSFSELCPDMEGACRLHTLTMTITTFSET